MREPKSEAISFLSSASLFCHTHRLFVLAAYSSSSVSHADGSITIPHARAWKKSIKMELMENFLFFYFFLYHVSELHFPFFLTSDAVSGGSRQLSVIKAIEEV